MTVALGRIIGAIHFLDKSYAAVDGRLAIFR